MAELASTPKGKGIEWAARSELTHIIHSFNQSINGLTPSEAGSNCPDKVPDTAAVRSVARMITGKILESSICLLSSDALHISKSFKDNRWEMLQKQNMQKQTHLMFLCCHLLSFVS
ncbi:uncharacterized protein RAG0_10352 [Rhynchosporium agropyri]|uniref:Uncharacterized protein n=1 Tax=Rhynchosporium agropyri TaxID=914238 RepID=A0A1E1KZG1_9HELO|nr:uncharacterized protein RAG0_10352 [Rhynchosporium agropyri]